MRTVVSAGYEGRLLGFASIGPSEVPAAPENTPQITGAPDVKKTATEAINQAEKVAAASREALSNYIALPPPNTQGNNPDYSRNLEERFTLLSQHYQGVQVGKLGAGDTYHITTHSPEDAYIIENFANQHGLLPNRTEGASDFTFRIGGYRPVDGYYGPDDGAVTEERSPTQMAHEIQPDSQEPDDRVSAEKAHIYYGDTEALMREWEPDTEPSAASSVTLTGSEGPDNSHESHESPESRKVRLMQEVRDAGSVENYLAQTEEEYLLNSLSPEQEADRNQVQTMAKETDTLAEKTTKKIREMIGLLAPDGQEEEADHSLRAEELTVKHDGSLGLIVNTTPAIREWIEKLPAYSTYRSDAAFQRAPAKILNALQNALHDAEENESADQ